MKLSDFSKDNTDSNTSIGGFTLVAYKLSNGKYQLGSIKGKGKIIDSFPDEIECFGNTYCLEHINEYKDGFVNIEYC